MTDSLKSAGDVLAGIPDAGTRMAALVICGFVLAILAALLYMRAKESDERAGL
jgi:ribose/xylose/arabinose/galactoside ABC-type transport system permease subunit